MLDDWGAVLGFDWARQNSQRVQGTVHMEAVAAPLNWSDLPEQVHPFFKALRSSEGERMVLEENIFIEKILPQAIIRQFTDEELNHYRQPFRNSGEDRSPTLSWPRSLPIDDELAEVVKVRQSARGARASVAARVPLAFLTWKEAVRLRRVQGAVSDRMALDRSN